MPEGEKVVLVLQPVGEVDCTAAEQLAHQAADGAVHISLASHGETLGGEPGQGHVGPLTQACGAGQLEEERGLFIINLHFIQFLQIRNMKYPSPLASSGWRARQSCCP